MTTTRLTRAARAAALVLGVLVALLGSTAAAGMLRAGPGQPGTRDISASAAVAAPATTAARIAERLGGGLRPAQDHRIQPAVQAAALLLIGGLLLLASVPPGRPLPSARGQWSTPARAPPMAS
jgi:hypothetical protein